MLDTLDDLLDRLSELPESLAVRFASPDGSFDEGYHITEFHLARIAAIDCGGELSARAEAVLQLRDGSDGHVITAQKLTRIAQHSRGRVPGLDAAPLWVEGAPGNSALARYRIDSVTVVQTRVVISLAGAEAQCGPSMQSGCCAAPTACCA